MRMVIAGVSFAIESSSTRVIDAARAHFAGYEDGGDGWIVRVEEADPRAIVHGDFVRPGELSLRVDLAAKTARAQVGALPDFFPPGCLQNLVRVLLVFDLAPRGGLLLHAASTVEEGRALAFFGVSGAGKSTVAHGFSAMLSDEITCITPDLHAHRAPFTGERLPPPVPLSAPLAGLFAIEQALSFSVRPLQAAEAVKRVLRCVVNVSHDRTLSRQLIDSSERLCARIPVSLARLPRLPDDPVAARAVFAQWLPSFESDG
jgi:hypothetical protein